ncbi:unnamed protein product [Amoebophrya sp. A25]|nr:unnamed protein product [Amoebophrya sp. A25]|eukprot:GSA25T00012447001.1
MPTSIVPPEGEGAFQIRLQEHLQRIQNEIHESKRTPSSSSTGFCRPFEKPEAAGDWEPPETVFGVDLVYEEDAIAKFWQTLRPVLKARPAEVRSFNVDDLLPAKDPVLEGEDEAAAEEPSPGDQDPPESAKSGEDLPRKHPLQRFVEASKFFQTSCDDKHPPWGPLLRPLNDCAKEAMVDFHASNLNFCLRSEFSPKKTNIVCSLLAFLLKLSVRGRTRNEKAPAGWLPVQQEVFVAFRDAILLLYRESVLTVGESQKVTDYASRTFFTHYRLYQYVCAHAVDRVVVRDEVALEFFSERHFHSTLQGWTRLGDEENDEDKVNASEQEQAPDDSSAPHQEGSGDQHQTQTLEQDGTSSAPPAALKEPVDVRELGLEPLHKDPLAEHVLQAELAEIRRRSDKMLGFIESQAPP